MRWAGIVIAAWLMLLPAAALATPWTVDDITDNNTGERTVSSLQMSESEPHTGLSLNCYDGAVRLQVIWSTAIGSGFVSVAVEWGVGPGRGSLGRPAAWEISPYSDKIAESPPGDAGRLAATIPEGMPFQLTVYTSGPRTAYFLSDGFKAAHDRVTANCE